MAEPIPASKFATAVYIIFGVLTGLPLLAIVLMKLPLFLDPANAVATGVVESTLEQAQYMRIMMLAFTGFGMTSLLYGLYRLFTGKRSAILKLVMFGLAIFALYEAYMLSKLI